MDKFILLTNEDGSETLANLHYITAFVEHEGKTYVGLLDSTPSVVLETVEDIVARIESNKGIIV